MKITRTYTCSICRNPYTVTAHKAAHERMTGTPVCERKRCRDAYFALYQRKEKAQ